MSNWADKITIIGIGISDEQASKIKKTIIEKMESEKDE